MLDINFIRQNPEKVKEACKNKGVVIDIDKLLELDKKRIKLQQLLEEIYGQKNVSSGEIALGFGEKGEIIARMQELDKEENKIEKEFKTIKKEFDNLLLQIPNIPFDDVPIGKDETGNVALRKVGNITGFKFLAKDYLEIGEKLDLIDIKKAAKVSGSRFGYLKNEAVSIEFSLIKFALDLLIKKGFTPILPPVMVKEEIAGGTGFLEGTDRQDCYYLPEDKLYLTGTSEQSLVGMHMEEILNEKDLPKRYFAFSTCFRREAGSYGKDTKGILRVHQFDKVEMIIFSKPEDSKKEHELLLSIEEELMKKLEIPYQVVNICTGDLGRPAAKKYDIETWIPSENKYRETHSTSNCTDFQARRLNIRYRNKAGKLDFVHTLNGTAFAIGRTLIAILENYQQKDGSVKIPKVLQKYTGFKTIKPKK